MAGKIDLAFLRKIASREINNAGYCQNMTKSAAPLRPD
jgi:hypothetical protein